MQRKRDNVLFPGARFQHQRMLQQLNAQQKKSTQQSSRASSFPPDSNLSTQPVSPIPQKARHHSHGRCEVPACLTGPRQRQRPTQDPNVLALRKRLRQPLFISNAPLPGSLVRIEIHGCRNILPMSECSEGSTTGSCCSVPEIQRE